MFNCCLYQLSKVLVIIRNANQSTTYVPSTAARNLDKRYFSARSQLSVIKNCDINFVVVFLQIRYHGS
ncbi:hypothetical protein MTP99_012620 [Tenebrio molitor]|nr:hypothetical protein MTP99_012620 [Tenebrio molitor]